MPDQPTVTLEDAQPMRPFRQVEWNPAEDITPYELARCIPAFQLLSDHDIEDYVLTLPPQAQRHFRIVGT